MDLFSGPCRLPVQVVDKNRAVGVELFQLQFCFDPFWTRKTKTNAKYISISNTLHLLSAAALVPHAEPFPASLVIDSSTLVSFSVDNNCKFELLCIQR